MDNIYHQPLYLSCFVFLRIKDHRSPLARAQESLQGTVVYYCYSHVGIRPNYASKFASNEYLP